MPAMVLRKHFSRAWPAPTNFRDVYVSDMCVLVAIIDNC